MWLKDGKYDFDLHHNSHWSVGVPGTVSGLRLAWEEHGSKPWKDLIMPAVALARDGFEVSHGLARSLAEMIPEFRGGRTIISTVLTTILNVVDFGMNAQEAVDAGRMHHQWLPDRLNVERYGFSADTIKSVQAMGHTVTEGEALGAAQVIVLNQNENMLEGGVDRRPPDGRAAGR